MHQSRQETRILQGRRKSVVSSTKISKHTTADMAYRKNRFNKPKFQIGKQVVCIAEKEAKSKDLRMMGMLNKRRGTVVSTSINKQTILVKFRRCNELIKFNADGTDSTSSAYIKEIN